MKSILLGIVAALIVRDGCGAQLSLMPPFTKGNEKIAITSTRFSPLQSTGNLVSIIAPIHLSPTNNQSEGRLIGYLPGWKTPPSAMALSNAGYTHIIIAFGVFSTKKPGEIVPAFEKISQEYIKLLQYFGIKVLLSVGGPSTNIHRSSVNFHQVLHLAASPVSFQRAFIKSLESLVNKYGFDGFDFDIEKGIHVAGSISKPTGDIDSLATIINEIHSRHPNWLLSLAPQVNNISASPSFNKEWGTYAALIMKTHVSLSWVGIQLYDTGCAFGIDKRCYEPKATNSPDFSVAMATDVLVDWPSKTNTGDVTSFQPYVSYLNPSQVVLGYSIPDATGVNGDPPVVPFATIKRAIQCLRTAVAGNNSCDNYIPPQKYQNIGGVFGWDVTFDQDNSFKFAATLKDCVLNGKCD